jgi:hypothetical protein
MGALVTKRKDMFSLMLTPKGDYKNILLLAYYRVVIDLDLELTAEHDFR